MEDLVSGSAIRLSFSGRKVFLTGHTGFKGAWLALWLTQLGADVYGYSLAPETEPNAFSSLGLEQLLHHQLSDIRDLEALRESLRTVKPDFVFHLAAQPLVRRSYGAPIETIETNILGTANLLEAIRLERLPCTTVVVTSDKCYENRDSLWGYREDEQLGGHDVYSMSKAAVELVVSSYRRSFFSPDKITQHGVSVATARAGNVVGGGDWAFDRIVPDVIRAIAAGRVAEIRNPSAIRPWQHVIEPLHGYLLLAQRLQESASVSDASFGEAWNFGPRSEDCRPVQAVVETLCKEWGSGSWVLSSPTENLHEAGVLRLNTDKATVRLGWRPRWRFEKALALSVEWYRAHLAAATAAELRALCLRQCAEYLADEL